jgi:transcription-repair coupling factor (superfamily II helicase)
MSLAGLLDAVVDDPAVARAVAEARSGSPAAATLDVTAPEGLRPFVVAALADHAGVPVLAVVATQREADNLVAAVGSLLREGPAAIAELPAWETLPHERLSPRADTVGRRLQVLRRLAHPGAEGLPPLRVVVAPVRAVLQPIVAGLGDVVPVALRQGEEVDGGLDALVDRLVSLSYTRTDVVTRRGEFAVRGGLIDVFPPTEEHPLRVELFGDEVDSVRAFAVADQRSLPADAVPAYGLVAPPCRELLLTAEVRERAKALAVEHPALVDVLDKIASGIAVEGMEALTPVLAERLELVSDVMPASTHVVLCDPEKVRTRAAELVATSQEFLAASWAAAASGAEAPLDLAAAAYRDLAHVRGHAIATGRKWWSVTPFAASPHDGEDGDDDTVVSPARPVEAYRGDLSRAFEDITAWVADGWSVVLTTEGHGSAQRLVESLREHDLGVRYDEGRCDGRPAPRVPTVCCGSLTAGFADAALRLALLTETDLAGAKGVSTRDMRRLPARRRAGIDPLALQPGDYVVHDKHGVGRFVRMERRVVLGGDREYLVLEYASGRARTHGQPDLLHVPTDQLDQLSRYSGGEAPSLNKLGGSDWAKAKGRARKAVREIAAELIRLYAARTSAPGHAFGPDTPWQRELEDAFPYVETPDQRAAIDEVKADMEKPVPMDRVICGDVGYGKTEIAVRAAFKAVMDGKQVAVLCPTTLLVQQHLQTFSERFTAFPARVRALSRFSSDAESREVLDGLAAGKVDVVIGTHRLLQPGVEFADLGLVVVDEEQRFGVEHKERLKQLRTNVDVLTMSATPIPRTLEMAITGIRELSTIDTPPEERHPVLTFVGPQDDGQVTAAIRRELLRDGQVFYVHNRVESIDRVARRLRDLVPEARIAVAHGQMGEDELERIMLAFWEDEVDVLVCTTIVENGLDVSNANTLVVERADALGLSQLHQLRGRVGRGRERAYAYFLYPEDKPLTETAHDRLATVAQHSELGGGMAVAMKDLEIRGAGNLLGGEQSGHIAAVGFDLYIRLVGEAVAEFKGEPLREPDEIKIDLPVDAYLPPDYVPVERLRLDAYRQLAAAEGVQDVAAVREELLDRYGPPPEPVEHLLAVAAFRVAARRFGVTEVQQLGRQVRFAPISLRESQTLRLQRLYPGSVVKPAAGIALVPAPGLRDTALLDWAAGLLGAVLDDPATTAATVSA